ncbi:MAG TPA: CocE/NonD family hydrolase [Gemmatimonadaceae bacterium]
MNTHTRLRAVCRRATRGVCFLAAVAVLIGCRGTGRGSPSIAGDWDVETAIGVSPHAGYEGWRRRAFAHFAPSDSQYAGFIETRAGVPMLDVRHADLRGDSVILAGVDGRTPATLAASWHGDTLVGVPTTQGTIASMRLRFIRRSTPFAIEKPYSPWPGPVSDSQYAVREDTLVYMTTRDGARLANYIARPEGAGPFGVVLQRTPYERVFHGEGEFWASRGYIYIDQVVRDRDRSDGDLDAFGDYDTDVRDGYDAVEWAARLTGANGRVGLIGHSDDGRLAWYAAVSAPPHLAAIAPSAATGDPWRIAPYQEMVFAPTNVAWTCLMRSRTLDDIADLDVGPALMHLPISDLPRQLGCGHAPMWDRWLAHPTRDAYWRAHAVTTNIARVRVPVLQISGWYDDSRGPVDYTDALGNVPGHPPIRLVMGPGAHGGIDDVAGDYGPESRVDTRRLQLRWFDHWLEGKDNGVDREPPVDIFVIGDNAWRHESAWPLARQVSTTWYLSSGGHANTSRGDGVIDSLPPNGAAADTFTYDPANPTPFLIDSRELETSLNEDYTALDAARADALVFTSSPLAKPLEVTGEMSAVIWAATDAKDADWNLMLLDVAPDGHAQRVQDGVVRARFRAGVDHAVPVLPDHVERYDVDLWFTSRVFEPGHRIRVTISSARFPKYDRNLGTGGDNERDSTFVVAHQRIMHDAAHPSHVVLPVIPR